MKMLFVVLLLAGIVFPSAVHSQEYLRREIMVNVIDPCLMHSVRREGLGEFVSEEEALALMKIDMEEPLAN